MKYFIQLILVLTSFSGQSQDSTVEHGIRTKAEIAEVRHLTDLCAHLQPADSVYVIELLTKVKGQLKIFHVKGNDFSSEQLRLIQNTEAGSSIRIELKLKSRKKKHSIAVKVVP